jgi:hypothetical protein
MFVYISRALDGEVWYQVCRLEDSERNHANSNNKNKGIDGLRSRSATREIELFEGAGEKAHGLFKHETPPVDFMRWH